MKRRRRNETLIQVRQFLNELTFPFIHLNQMLTRLFHEQKHLKQTYKKRHKQRRKKDGKHRSCHNGQFLFTKLRLPQANKLD